MRRRIPITYLVRTEETQQSTRLGYCVRARRPVPEAAAAFGEDRTPQRLLTFNY